MVHQASIVLEVLGLVLKGLKSILEICYHRLALTSVEHYQHYHTDFFAQLMSLCSLLVMIEYAGSSLIAVSFIG